MNIQVSIRHMMASNVINKMVNDLCQEVNSTYQNIRRIDVKLEDINGPFKSGIDKRCHLKVRGSDHLCIDIDDVDEDILSAIERAFHHLKKALKSYYYNLYKRHTDNVDSCYFIESKGLCNE